MYEIQISALIFLAIVTLYDLEKRSIPVYHFLAGALITTLIGYLVAGNNFLLYLAIFGVIFSLGGALGVRYNAWYKGEALVMPILAAATYRLNLLAFFIFLVTLIPGTAWALRKTDLYEKEDEPLLPAFLLVFLLTWIFEILWV